MCDSVDLALKSVLESQGSFIVMVLAVAFICASLLVREIFTETVPTQPLKMRDKTMRNYDKIDLIVLVP